MIHMNSTGQSNEPGKGTEIVVAFAYNVFKEVQKTAVIALKGEDTGR